MFIRTKRIRKNGKDYLYAYLVQNRWRKSKKASRQRVKGYLGKVISFEKIREQDFFEHSSIADVHAYVKSAAHDHILRDLIAWELWQHGFSAKEGIWSREDISFDVRTFELYQQRGERKNPRIVSAMNEGFLCNATLKMLLSLGIHGSEEKIGFKWASLLTEAGIKIPQELFVVWMTKMLGR